MENSQLNEDTTFYPRAFEVDITLAIIQLQLFLIIGEPIHRCTPESLTFVMDCDDKGKGERERERAIDPRLLRLERGDSRAAPVGSTTTVSGLFDVTGRTMIGVASTVIGDNWMRSVLSYWVSTHQEVEVEPEISSWPLEHHRDAQTASEQASGTDRSGLHV